MLKEIPQDDILVLNGDVVTKLDFDYEGKLDMSDSQRLMQTHEDS